MRMVTRIYIDGAFVTPHGTEMLDLFDPVRGEVLGQDRLVDAEDGPSGDSAAKRPLPTYAAPATRNGSNCCCAHCTRPRHDEAGHRLLTSTIGLRTLRDICHMSARDSQLSLASSRCRGNDQTLLGGV